MPSYCLRIDGALQAVLAWIAAVGVNGWAVREVASTPEGGDNEHWHFHLWGDKTIKQLRCTFNRQVPELKGNGAYSLTLCRDADKYDRYMAKGVDEHSMPDVAFSSCLTYNDDQIKILHDEYWAENKKMKRKAAASMIDFTIDEAKARRIDWQDRQKLSEIYIKEIGDRGKPINLFSTRSNLNAVQYALCPDDSFLKILCERVEQY